MSALDDSAFVPGVEPSEPSWRGSSPVLAPFHPAVRTWFERRFEHGPTAAQEAGWPAIARGEDTLIAAPTGSGKTLSAFLVCIDRLYRAAERGELSEDTTEVVYVSPLKALVTDIHENLERPLSEIRAVAEELGLPAPAIRVATRSGDTPPAGRLAMVKHPPHFLITTPESLYLMITSARSRENLRHVRTVIVDEIHAVARDKRGSHLALTLERLEHVARERPQRVGLSATQRPIERVARLLVGATRSTPEGAPRCTIADVGHRRELDLALLLPSTELSAVASTEQMADVLDQIAKLVLERRTTLVFVNTRRLSERLAHLLAERLGADQVAAHHGSLSKERRLRVETRLREGSLKALVATASLELGIDVGPVELVCQVGSPRSIATFLQRVGRAGHSRFATPVGRLFPLTRDELVECAALLRAVHAGRLDAIAQPVSPLDILAQQVVAECAAETWQEDALYDLMRRAAPFQHLPRADFDSVVELMSQGIATGRGKRAAYLQRDRMSGELKARRGARLAAITSGGAIPDNADYRVVAEPDDTFIGTINEDFAIESMAGDVFLLGSTSWRIRRVEKGVVRVVDAEGAAPTIPFWLGEAPARTVELSEEVSELRAGMQGALEEGGVHGGMRWAAREASLDETATRALSEYLEASRVSLGLLPTRQDIVFERFFDDTGGMQLVAHSPFGGRLNRGLGLLMRKRFCRSFDFELQAAASDDSVILSLGPQHSFPMTDVHDFLAPRGVPDALVHAVLVTPMWAARWRWNLNRALVVLRMKNGKKNPPQIQRMEVDDVTAAVFPSLAACQDNAVGPREIPDHPLVRQTLDDCLNEAMDTRGLEQLLDAIAGGQVRLHFRETTEPSPLCHEILNSRPYTFLDDAPLEERRTRAVQVRRGLPVQARDLARLDPEAISRVRAEVWPEPRDEGEFWDLLLSLRICRPDSNWQPLFECLSLGGRALTVHTARGPAWCATESVPRVRCLFPEARFEPEPKLPPSVANETLPDRDLLLAEALRGQLEIRGPVTPAELSEIALLEPGDIAIALARLEAEGFAMRGNFEFLKDLSSTQYISRRALTRIHFYTQATLRKEIQPVSAQDFMRFLLRFQGLTQDTRRSGQRGVLSVIEQLQGFEAASGAWERELLAARVSDYRSEWLDALCLSGEVSWGRLSLRASPSDDARSATVSRATPITLAIREDLPWLLSAVRRDAEPSEPSGDLSARLLDVLRQRGALFFGELLTLLDVSRAELAQALWDAVARGLIAADGFNALRALLSPVTRAHAVHANAFGRGLRRGASARSLREGRWALVPRSAQTDRDELAEAVAEQLLARWGVVFYDLLARESIAIPYRELVWAYRRLEARGVIRGGRFVTGFVGEQFALPEAVDMLRSVKKLEKRGEVCNIAACDPLNLVGILLPGARLPAQRGQVLTLVDGAPVGAESA
ncbi:MAG TPA: DEAD/DEAH box helicase [Polyangiaceae bacterium]|jgi:ATP-dependent Lhr-like helicase